MFRFTILKKIWVQVHNFLVKKQKRIFLFQIKIESNVVVIDKLNSKIKAEEEEGKNVGSCLK